MPPGGIRIACLLWLMPLLAVRAHQPGLSTLFVDLHPDHIAADLIVAWRELELLVPLDVNQNGELADSELGAARSNLLALAETAVSLDGDGQMLPLTRRRVERDDTTGIRLSLQFERPAMQVLLVRAEILEELPPAHRQIIIVRGTNGEPLKEWVLERDRNLLEVLLDSPAPEAPAIHSLEQFLWLGLEHIVMGWDHLAFLFSLLVVGGRLRDAVKIITSFTVAHSLTLALATFDLIRIPSAVVEPLIAASIVYVGVENIVRDNYRGRWALTFAFGLIHGCGFATILRDLGIGTHGGSVAGPLVCFNLGVELGQLAIAGIMLPVIWKLKPRFPARWIPATSLVAILLGSYWLIERTFL